MESSLVPLEDQLPHDVMRIIVRYVYGSVKSFGRLSLASQRWIKSAYTALDYIDITDDIIPLQLPAPASPSHVRISSYTDRRWTQEETTSVAKLLSSAKVVYVGGKLDWNLYAVGGCLKKVEELSLSAESVSVIKYLLFGYQDSSPAQTHPLRVLEYRGALTPFVVNLFNSENFPHLSTITFTDKSFPPLTSHASLKRLTWIQHDTRCLSTKFLTREDGNGNRAASELITKMKEEIPPHLAADLSQVCFTDLNGLTTPMDAIPFLLAQSVAQVESALRDYPLTDVRATLFALGANHLREFYDPDTDTVNFINVTPQDLELQQYKIQALLDRGADLFTPVVCQGQGASRVSTTVFHIALMFGYPATVSALYSFVTAEQVNRIRDQYGLTPLHCVSHFYESWIECFNWHNSRVPSWKMSDVDNVYNESPIARMLKNYDGSTSTLTRFLGHIMQQKECFSELSLDYLRLMLSSLAQRWKDSDEDFDADDDEIDKLNNLARAIEKNLQSRSAEELGADRDYVVLAFLLVALPDIFKKIIKGLPATHLVDALAICMNVSSSIIDHFFDALKSNGMEHIPLITSQGESIIERCGSELDVASFAKLVLDYSIDPVLSTHESNCRIISVFARSCNGGEEEDDDDEEEYDEEDNHEDEEDENEEDYNRQEDQDRKVDLKQSAALASVYLEKKRPDLALLLFSEAISRFCERSGNFKYSQPTLREFEPLCSLLFSDEQFLGFLEDPVSTSCHGEAPIDLKEVVLTVLMGPFDLSPLSEDLYATLLQRLVARVVAYNTTVDQTVSESVLRQSKLKPVFVSALLTFYVVGDEKRQQAVMSVLPQLVEVASIVRVRFYDVDHFMKRIETTNPAARALLARVFE